jgi:PAB-dependent poly(A)-specific ribonuclease subunit 2
MSYEVESASEPKGEPAPDSSAPTELESLKPEAPHLYRDLEIKYSKFGVDDFDFG